MECFPRRVSMPASPSPSPCRRRKPRPPRAPRRSKPGNPTSPQPRPTRRRPRRRGIESPAPAHAEGEDALGNGSGGDPHGGHEPHQPAAESPVEMLPPISGGAPDPDEPQGGEAPEPDAATAPPASGASTGTMDSDSRGPEASGESSNPGDSPAASEPAATFDHFPVPDDWEPEESGPGAGTAAEPETLAAAVSAEAIAHDQAESGAVEPAAEPAATGDHLPPPGHPATEGGVPQAIDGQRGGRRGIGRRGESRRTNGPGLRPASAPGEAPRPGALRVITRARVAGPAVVHATAATVAAPAAPRRRPARPARLCHRQRGRRQRLFHQPGRPRRAARISTPRSAARSRSAVGCRTRSPSWSRSSRRTSASGSTSTTSTPSSSRRRSSR